MTERERVRYVDGGCGDGSGRWRWIHAYVNGHLCVTYKGYTRGPEDNAMVLYPFRVRFRGEAPCDKHTISIFDIEKR